jgi:hypothetical protein
MFTDDESTRCQTMNERNLQQAKANVREGEMLIKRQKRLVRRLEEAGHYEVARTARELLATLTETLNVSRKHLELERRQRPRLDARR